MKEVRYVGPHEAVDVPLPDGRVLTVAGRGVLKTSDEHAASLLEQETNWRPVVAKPKQKKAPPVKPAAAAEAAEPAKEE